MNIDIVIRAIKATGPLALRQAQKTEFVIKVLQKLKLNPAQPPKDFDGVYAYTLVEYGIAKSDNLLDFFREKEIQQAFWQTFHDNPQNFIADAENFLDWNILGDKIRDEKIDIHQEIKEFYQAFLSVTKRTRNPAEILIDPNFKEMGEILPYPDQFKSLIEEKIRAFRGRKFVFAEFDKFLKTHQKGYFTVIGDAGMGKSAIAAKYVFDHQTICYFNVIAEGSNRPEQFLDSIRQQLGQRYHLTDVNNTDLSTLLNKISGKLATNEQLIIVVDALDEVAQESGAENILYLPKTLPDGIYFFLTRRPYEPNKKRLFTEGLKQQELDLTAPEYLEFNRADVQEYIRLFINEDSEHKHNLNQWIQNRNISPEEFIQQVSVKSENNFMYLRYVLPGIAQGLYNDLSLQQLPAGLQEYYQIHWERMGMEKAPNKLMVIILFILVEIGTAITCEMITEISEQDECDVADILDTWREYLKKREIQGEICYSIYHASFLEFLKGKRELQASRKIFAEVNQRIADYLY
jgi:hypothetical protein